MTDIVKRLREAREFELRDYEPTMQLYKDAADEIERLRAALQSIADYAPPGVLNASVQEMLLRSYARDALVPPVKTSPSDLFEIAKHIMHGIGMPWTDPRTGITYPPPKSSEK